jgi:hypothetical protein
MKAIFRAVKRFNSVYVFSLIFMMPILVMQTPVAYAGEKSPYESGYNHGCNDAKISDPSDRYINQPEKGPSFHTDEFMNGYNDGYNACSGDASNMSGSDSNSLSKNDRFRVIVTFIEGPDRNVDDARVYIQEHPQYGIPGGTDSGFIDLIDAFYNDAPYTGIWEDEITMPSDLIDAGEEFHVCIEDTKKDATLACYELENGSESEPERIRIDFNDFP